jgi:hypothetical protein
MHIKYHAHKRNHENTRGRPLAYIYIYIDMGSRPEKVSQSKYMEYDRPQNVFLFKRRAYACSMLWSVPSLATRTLLFSLDDIGKQKDIV